MTYNLNDFDESASIFVNAPYDAEIVNAGVTHRDKSEQMVLLCQPANTQMRLQAVQLAMGSGTFKLGGVEETISFGEGAKKWGMTLYSEIISGPKLKTITNAGLFLNMLKHLGFEVETGDMRGYIGLKLTLEEVAINEAIERFNAAHPKLKNIPARTGDFADKTITIPVALLETPKVKTTLKQDLIAALTEEGRTEDKVVDWYKQTEHYNGTATTPVILLLDALEKDGEIAEDEAGAFVVE
jgi:hypothetical protein